MDIGEHAAKGPPEIGAVGFEDLGRARFYALLTRVFAEIPEPEFLDELAAVSGDETPLGRALEGLAAAARRCDGQAVSEEYTKLFYGMGQGGEVLPYASYYISGFLYDRPLAWLRGDMERLGIARGGVNSEPEDHIAYLMEMMHGLIMGSFGTGRADHAEQRNFFERHLAGWVEDFLADLAAAPSADFYRAVAELGTVFVGIEKRAFKDFSAS